VVLPPIRETNIIRVLAVGFALVIILLLADGFVGIKLIQSIREGAARLVEDQFVTTSLVDEIQREQGALSAVFYNLARDPDSLNRDEILTQIDGIEQNIHRIVSAVPEQNRKTGGQWTELEMASAAFAREARRLLALEEPPTLLSRELFRRHEEVLSVVARLIRASHDNANQARSQIEVQSRSLIRRSTLLLGGCLLFASACAVLTLRMATVLFRRMTAQTEELSRVSWHLLENQEVMARRLSHELHDELGQSLTALKTNFTRHSAMPCADPRWLEDCGELLKESIRSVHEISLLLRPTILDDFGLSSAVGWLCDRFGERSRIAIEYDSSLAGRLSEEAETHLFRIAQEALTNVARHSGATCVRVQLVQEGDTVRLSIQDNGRGLPPEAQLANKGLGLVGMRARARSANGELTIRSAPGEGVFIEASVPLERQRHEEKDPHLVG
jgi:signal transduction histidine kinase